MVKSSDWFAWWYAWNLGEYMIFLCDILFIRNYTLLLQNSDKDFATFDKDFPVYILIKAVSQVIFVMGKDFTGLLAVYLFADWTQNMFGDILSLPQRLLWHLLGQTCRSGALLLRRRTNYYG